MLNRKQPIQLAFGVGKMSSDPLTLAHQREILGMVRQRNIKLLDTARHYVSPQKLQKFPGPTLILVFRAQENLKRSLAMRTFILNSRL
jgi:hypothetical protein